MNTNSDFFRRINDAPKRYAPPKLPAPGRGDSEVAQIKNTPWVDPFKYQPGDEARAAEFGWMPQAGYGTPNEFLRGAYQDAWRAQGAPGTSPNDAANLLPTTTPPRPDGPGGPGGGGVYVGGGGGVDPNFAAYQAAMQGFINSPIKNPYDGLKNPWVGKEFVGTAAIDPAVDADIAAAKAAFAEVANKVDRGNPYQNLPATRAEVDPGLAALAERQGVSDSQAAAVAAAQQDAANMAANWANLGSALGVNHVAGQKSLADIANQQAATVEAGFEAQRAALQQAAARQQQQMDDRAVQWQAEMDAQRAAWAAQQEEWRRQQLMELALAGLQYGG